MAARSVTAAALRHRPRQAILVVVLAAVVTGAAVLGPLYSRAVEQSVLRTVVAAASPAERALVVTDASKPATAPRALARAVRGEVPPQFGTPIGGAETQVDVSAAGADRVQARLTSRDGLCAHVTIAVGRCPRAAGEVLISRRAADSSRIANGSAVTLTDGDPGQQGVRVRGRVVGLYDTLDVAAPYWAGRGQVPAATARPTAEDQTTRTIDDVFTPWATLAASRWPDLRTHLDIPLQADRVDLGGLDAVRGATDAVDTQARTLGASAASTLDPLLARTVPQRDEAREVIPLLAVQLAFLGIVVLAFVCAAATEQRRPEIALARLRGHGTLGAAGMLLRELGLLVLAGTVVGTVLGWLVASLAAGLWLEPGITLEARVPVAAAVLASFAAGLLAIVAAALPTLRQPLTSLLRRVPPRASTLQAGLVEGAVVAAAAAGVVTLLTGDGGPIALLAPGLLAIAGGLLLAQATIPTAGPLARVAMRRGRLSWALAGLQIARRPALRRLIAIITVACALLVFAVDAWSVAGRNRDTRAEVEAGAPVVLGVDAHSPKALRDAVLAVDPKGSFATPVVTVSSATETGPRTTAVEPAAFARIARWGHDPSARPKATALAGLKPTPVRPIRLTGTTAQVTATLEAQGIPQQLGGPVPDLAPITISMGVETKDGTVHLLPIGHGHDKPTRYRIPIPCAQGCLLRQFVVTRTFGNFADANIRLTVSRLAVGTGTALTPVDLGTEQDDAWQPVPLPGESTGNGIVSTGKNLVFGGETYSPPLTVQRGDRPAVASAIATGALPLPLSTSGVRPVNEVVAPDLLGGQVVFTTVGRTPFIPRSGNRGILVDLASVVTGPLSAPGSTSYAVWLAADDAGREATLRHQLADHGLQVTSRDTTGMHAAGFSLEGPSLALRLALLAGLVAVVLAASVLVVGVATSGTGRARDLAGLRLVGVPARTVQASAVREHLVVAVLGVLAGSTLGLVAAQAALPDIPLFARHAVRLPLDLSPAWLAVLATVLACLVLLSAVSVVVGRALAASAVPARLREGR